MFRFIIQEYYAKFSYLNILTNVSSKYNISTQNNTDKQTSILNFPSTANNATERNSISGGVVATGNLQESQTLRCAQDNINHEKALVINVGHIQLPSLSPAKNHPRHHDLPRNGSHLGPLFPSKQRQR